MPAYMGRATQLNPNNLPRESVSGTGGIKPNPKNLDSVRTYMPCSPVTSQDIQEALQKKSGTDVPTSAEVPKDNSSDLSDSQIRDIINNCPTNPLNEYDNYSYHLRWSVANDISSYNFYEIPSHNGTAPPTVNLSNLDIIVIAETGITGINIIDFSTETACGPSDKMGNMPAMTFKMTVIEPYSISLIDKIVYATQQLGTHDFTKSSYFIEVWFNGYNDDGTAISATPNTDQQRFYHLWRVLITGIEATATEVGTTWQITGAADGEYASSNYVSFVPGTITVETGNTFGEFLKNLTKAMNDEEQNRVKGYQPTLIYKFVTTDEVSQWTMKTNDPNKNSKRSAPFSSELSISGSTITLNSGTDIGHAVNFAASLSPNADKWVMGKIKSTDSDGLIKIFVINSQAKIIDYVTGINDYIREITYTLVPYLSAKADIDVEAIKDISQPTVQNKKLQTIIQSQKFNRVYNYFYTGKNLDVMKFDITMKNFWIVAIPAYGAVNSNSQQTIGPVVQEHSIGWTPTADGFNSDIITTAISKVGKNIDSSLNLSNLTSTLLPASVQDAVGAPSIFDTLNRNNNSVTD